MQVYRKYGSAYPRGAYLKFRPIEVALLLEGGVYVGRKFWDLRVGVHFGSALYRFHCM